MGFAHYADRYRESIRQPVSQALQIVDSQSASFRFATLCLSLADRRFSVILYSRRREKSVLFSTRVKSILKNGNFLGFPVVIASDACVELKTAFAKMDGDLIILDDELHLLADIAQEQQLQQQMYAVNPGPSRRSQRVKAVERPPVQPPKQTAVRGRGVKRTRNGDKIPPAKVLVPQTIPASDQYSSSVIVDGQDVYYIQEVDDASSESVEQVPYLDPNAIMSFAEEDDDDGTDTDDAPEVPDERPLTEEEEYYNVEPLELSDIWNDLITANQEILILLELSDLKDHIVDARRIEEQIRDMVS